MGSKREAGPKGCGRHGRSRQAGRSAPCFPSSSMSAASCHKSPGMSKNTASVRFCARNIIILRYQWSEIDEIIDLDTWALGPRPLLEHVLLVFCSTTMPPRPRAETIQKRSEICPCSPCRTLRVRGLVLEYAAQPNMVNYKKHQKLELLHRDKIA